MSMLEKIRTITVLSIPAAALVALLFALSSSDSDVQFADPLTLCATSKGALCEEYDAAIRQDSIGPVSVADLGELIVSAQRSPDVTVAAAVEDATLLGAITVTASRPPSARLAKAKSEAGAREF